jgi:ATP-dependent DNA ligase
VLRQAVPANAGPDQGRLAAIFNRLEGAFRAERGRAGARANSADRLHVSKSRPILAAWLIIPGRPVLASMPPSGADWVHEIKHHGYRIIVRRDGCGVRLHSRDAMTGLFDWRRSRLPPS